ncbi:MAG: glycoside hydrolase family 3 protein [Gemmatimonadales bacterium]|nr:MAG: glycoside hydrolase family 3 protein [Gemmatimonadales bacterium]
MERDSVAPALAHGFRRRSPGAALSPCRPPPTFCNGSLGIPEPLSHNRIGMFRHHVLSYLLVATLLALPACASAPSSLVADPGEAAPGDVVAAVPETEPGPGEEPGMDPSTPDAPTGDAAPPAPVQDTLADARIAPPRDSPVGPGDRTPVEWRDRELPTGPGSGAGTGAWTEATLAEMTLRQKVGQMIMPWMLGDFAPEGSAGFDRIARLIEQQEIGGIIVSVGTPLDVAAKLNVLQRRSRLPLLVAADLETGAGFRMRGAVYLPGVHDLGGATNFPSLMAVGAADDRLLAYEMGRITAQEARAVGIHVPFAPVLDVNSNPDNPIINTRSFGEDPARVSELGVCFIRGVQEHGAVATGKHFPGHGDTETDSHLALPIIRADRERLNRVEMPPFRAAVEAGMGAIMTAHIALPALTEEARLPATLSRNVLTGLLREDWGFQGLVFTDAMDMNAIDRLYSREEAAVRAVLAGADVLLMPPDPEVAIRGVMNAVLSGRISEARIDASVRRILRQKEDLDLHGERTVDLEAVHRTVGVPSHTAVAREVAERSLTLLKNDRNLLPLRGTRTANVLSLTYRRTNDIMGGRAFDARLRQTYPRLQTTILGQDTPSAEYERLFQRGRAADLVVISLHVTAVSYAGSVAIPEELARLISRLSAAGVPHVVVSFGNPYLLREFPTAQAYLLAWSGSEASQRAAAGSLFGDVAIRGRTPTRIPPGFEIGAGISLPGPAVAARSGTGSRPGAAALCGG